MAAVSGVSGMGVVYPFDIIKTQLQTRTKVDPNFVRSVMSVGRSIVVASGVSGLWRGFGTASAGIAPQQGLMFAINDWAREYYIAKHPALKITGPEELCAGTAAGIVQLFVAVPYEHVKIKLQIAPEKSASQVIQEIGLRNLFRGFTATFVRDVPFCLVYFPLYSYMKSSYMTMTQSTEEPLHIGILAGMMSGMIGGAITTPGDMVKTLIQKSTRPVSTIGTFQRVIQKEGATALFKGWNTRVLIIGLSYGIISGVYELQKRLLA
eukprot:CAMPEP_0182420530 /NCGR_PEP_ID=MMETSP1167-20130531/5387_1 /TAXON_ID=2988 /ORGANISM="Mallomonas Sp, Strain CCMP3275" /LENGTH=264 /DNA_ID=CAMNT_0024596581 /DNA_START=81 /DNA_END=875 /DNA_ORIENTATION=-